MYPLLHAEESVRILLVEDNRAASTIIGRTVAMHFPYAVVYSADNGITGMELFHRHRPDIVITDIAMHKMDGLQMASEIRALRPEVKLIVFTAHSRGDFLGQFEDLGVHAFLLKPLDLDDLMQAIRSASVKPLPQDMNTPVQNVQPTRL